ncbi:YqiA/YcfP family alpha/beta fold hydrolase [Nitrosophilus alvini]|uniref:YqiA/YcfP family alpha/beta fold hydrolase n=1 Tax=Nitrosophilus alvini TaxID=2714855 RepID=UPI00190B7805|nr:YqiA/YcfP family alpha/beta fold hydrolase [Nitrosophilus alvini]
MIIYIHGFGGSGEGNKARIARNYFKERILTPSLSYVPDLAISTLEDIIKKFLKYEDIYLIGSSLGGYYSIYLAETYNLKTVLINPSVKPYETLSKWTGFAQNFYDNSRFEWNEKHIEMLKKYDVKYINDQSRYMLMLQKGDELLDFRVALRKLPEADLILEEGGSHQFEGFENHLSTIERFFEDI